MSTFNLLEARLKSTVLFSHAASAPFFMEQVDAVPENGTVRSGTMYVSSLESAEDFIRSSVKPLREIQALFLLSSETMPSKSFRNLCEKEDIEVIVTSESEAALYLHAAKTCQYYLRIAEKVDEISKIKNTQEMIHAISGFLQENILMVSADGTLLCEVGSIRPSTRAYLQNSFVNIMREHADFGTAAPARGEDPELFYIRIKNRNTVIGVLLIERDQDVPNDYQKFFKKLLPYLRDYVLSELSSSQNDQMKFDRIWKDMMEGRFSSDQDIRNVFAYAGLKIKKYFRMILVQGSSLEDRGQGAYAELYGKIKGMLPDSMITRYYSDMVILDWYDEHSFELPEQIKRLDKPLRQYGCRACVCWQSGVLAWVSLLYEFSSQVLRLEQQLSDPKTNSPAIVEFGQYSPYLLIDMCAQYARNVKHTRNIVLLTHPAVINLYRYDQDHNTNLEEVLFYYLVNHRSLGLTARSLYMHRNTIVNKIKKIRELTPMDMDSPEVQAHLIISHYLLKYNLKVIDDSLL